MPEKPKLNANAAPFVLGEGAEESRLSQRSGSPHVHYADSEPRDSSPAPMQPDPARQPDTGSMSDRGADSDKSTQDIEREPVPKQASETTSSSRRESSTGIWSSWRQGSNS